MDLLKHPYVAPFALFMALLGLWEFVDKIFEGTGPFLTAYPEHWIFPLQAVACGLLLFKFRKEYNLKAPAQVLFTLFVAVVVLVIWVAPQEFLGFPRREEGFDPSLFEGNPLLGGTVIAFRFLRLVIVVPLLEEIFWRGFLMRYLVDQPIEKVPFGAFTPKSFLLVTLFFGLAHFGPDFVPALICGALYNWIACKTKSLSACILAHAVTNLLLGIYIMATRQWGFW